MNKKQIEKKALSVICPKCWVIEGKRCLDMRVPEGKTKYLKRPHKERMLSLTPQINTYYPGWKNKLKLLVYDLNDKERSILKKLKSNKLSVNDVLKAQLQQLTDFKSKIEEIIRG